MVRGRKPQTEEDYLQYVVCEAGGMGKVQTEEFLRGGEDFYSLKI